MSTEQPEITDTVRVAANLKPQRVLACQMCQQRKVKCDRKFPCANCLRNGAQCVPATIPRERRRRFPERELLARIRHYEALLHQHNINFEPLHPSHHPSAGITAAENQPGSSPLSGGSPVTPSSTVQPQVNSLLATKTRPANLWHAVGQKSSDAEDDDDEADSGFLHNQDDLRDAVIKNAWDHHTYNNDLENTHHLLFGSPVSKVELATLHPEQAKILRLWQIYLDNVNPLLKVTHTPSLQGRIIDAVGDLTNLGAPLEALLFSIYCVSVLSLLDDQCHTLFGSRKNDLLTGYQFACRQALLNANVLQSSDHDCLTALYLYLVSVRPETDPRSLSSMLAVAIRIAQRMGYHNESNHAKCSALEAEMRRRLWWSLVIFDNRICEMFNYRTATLAPTWNCRTPLNLNDFELLPDMKAVPRVHTNPTEAVFVVVRSQLSDFVRHCAFHLDFIDPLLTTFAQAKDAATGGAAPLGGRNALELQRAVEEGTLAHCDPANPLHFMTIWTARAYMAKILLLEHCSRHAKSKSAQPLADPQQQQHHNPGVGYALNMIECDTKLMSSPLTKGYRWHIEYHFPFLAYTYLLQHLKKQPRDDSAAQAWEVMSDCFEARGLGSSEYYNSPFLVLLSRLVLQAWEARDQQQQQQQQGDDASLDRSPPVETRPPPRIVASISAKIGFTRAAQGNAIMEQEQPSGDVGNSTISLDPSSADPSLHMNMGGNPIAAPPSFAVPPAPGGGLPDMFAGSGMMDLEQLWPAMDLGLMQRRHW